MASILLRDNASILTRALSICLPLHLQLFDHVSESLKDFLVEENIDQKDKQPLAFTFSFPCEHSALDKVFTLYNFLSGHHQSVCSRDDSVPVSTGSTTRLE